MTERSPHLLSVVLVLLAALFAPPADASTASQDGAVENAVEAATGEAQDAAAAVSEATDDAADAAAEAAGEAKDEADDWMAAIDGKMAKVNKAIADVIFYPIPIPGTDGNADPVTGEPAVTPLPFTSIEVKTQVVPFAVLWLILGAIFFTVRMGFVQLRLVPHAIQVVRGKYDDDHDGEGEVSHFQALSAALSATVGLGNIAGVALAIAIGGPGATFWMIVAGLLGMASKFTECTLGQMYRQERSDGSVMGGAMYYLSNGLKDMGAGVLGKLLAITFAIMCIGGSMAGGNSFQVNQSLGAMKGVFPVLGDYPWAYGLVMTIAVGVVILGGIRRIAEVASAIVPAMCAIYVVACLAILFMASDQIVPAFQTIFDGAFNADAALGGLVGVLIVGFKRAAFSNEAGVGSAAIAHSAAKTKYPVREGIVALLEPLIDTVIICTMTALVIVISKGYVAVGADGEPTAYAEFIQSNNGAGLTLQAFQTSIGDWFGYVLGIAVALFAFSTMISWSYYGERCFAWLFGDGLSVVYKVLFLCFTFIGSVVTGTQVLEFGDLMILGMAIPNVIGVVLLSGKVKTHLGEYLELKRSGQM